MGFAEYQQQKEPNQQPQPAESGGGGFAGYVSGKTAPTSAPIQTDKVIQQPQPWQVSGVTPMSEGPSTIANTAKQGVIPFFAGLGGNLLKDAGDVIGGISNLVTHAPVGAVSNLLSGLGLVDRPTEGYLGDSANMASALPGAVMAIPGQIKDTGQVLLNTTGINGGDEQKRAVYQAGNYLYGHPVQTALNISGAGDAIGSGVKFAGDIADRAAIEAAAKAAGLTAEEAASAALPTTGRIGQVGSDISAAANSINPVSGMIQGIVSAKNAGGNMLNRFLGFTTRTGKEGSGAIDTIANGGDVGKSAVNGMRGLPTSEESQAFKEAVRNIDVKNVENANMFSQGTMQGIQKNVVDSLGEHGINVVVMSPADQEIIMNELTAGRLTPQGEEIFSKYWNPKGDSGITPVMDTSGKIKTKFLSSDHIPELSAQQKATMMEEALNNGGFVGIGAHNGIAPRLSPSAIKQVVEEFVRPAFKTGSYNGYDATAQTLNTLKSYARNLYKDNSPLAPISNEQKALNALSGSLAGHVEEPLLQFPEYQNVMNKYKAYYQGQKLNNLLPGTFQSLMQGSPTLPIEAAAAYGASHLLGGAGAGLVGLLSSPRAIGELANMYGKAASVTGKAAAPLISASNSGAISALIKLLSGNANAVRSK